MRSNPYCWGLCKFCWAEYGWEEGGHHALEGGQFWFWSNLKVPYYVNLRHKSVIWEISSHSWWIKKQILGSQKWTSNTEKIRKRPKTANFGYVLVYSRTNICSTNWRFPFPDGLQMALMAFLPSHDTSHPPTFQSCNMKMKLTRKCVNPIHHYLESYVRYSVLNFAFNLLCIGCFTPSRHERFQ